MYRRKTLSSRTHSIAYCFVVVCSCTSNTIEDFGWNLQSLRLLNNMTLRLFKECPGSCLDSWWVTCKCIQLPPLSYDFSWYTVVWTLSSALLLSLDSYWKTHAVWLPSSHPNIRLRAFFKHIAHSKAFSGEKMLRRNQQEAI